MKKLMAVFLVILLSFPLTASAGGTGSRQNTGPVFIRVFSNLPDRENGRGLVEQLLLEKYLQENPHVTMDCAYTDSQTYTDKFRVLVAAGDLPDLVSLAGWRPQDIDTFIGFDIFAELNKADYKDYGFLEGSLDGYSKDGKLYGLPRGLNLMTFYYNKALFDKHGWTVPASYNDLLAMAPKIRAAGLAPVSMSGGDKWLIPLFMTDLMTKLHGAGVNGVIKEAVAKKDFSAPEFAGAAKLLQKSYDAGLFQPTFEIDYYYNAKELFMLGKAAMYYGGSWDMSMATDGVFPPEVRDNIRSFSMPTVAGGKGKPTDITAWVEGGHAVSAYSKVQAEAVKLLNYIYRPDNWSRLAWENSACVPAQNFPRHKTGIKIPVQLNLFDMLTSSTSISGAPFNEMGTQEFMTASQELSYEVAIKAITPEQFVSELTNISINYDYGY